MARTIFCKLLQRKTYDILSKKHAFLLLIFGCIVLFIAALHFGETMLEWSKEKYAVVFSPYSNNILSKSYRNMLCQYVPIDVVYTWVNGTDPKFLRELAKAKADYGFSNSHLNCTFSHCVKSHMVLVRPPFPNSITLGDLEESDPLFEHIEKIFVVSSSQGSIENVTVLVFPSIEIATQVVAKKNVNFDGQNFTFYDAYLTDTWGYPGTVSVNNIFLLTNVASDFPESEIKEKFPLKIKQSINKVFIYEEKSVAVLTVKDSSVLNFVKKMNNVTFNNKVASVASAYLVVELPSDHEDISASRFTDNEELRYSLRSLEKHAPWVQHVYIITNGQIPYWLNLDNQWVTVITHDEIFPNKSHLPTFSSPAIECHIHRIPNLSKKFLYLNDDVMFGKDVWPEDFYTHTKGQKVYLSWPVPNCAEGCPSSWIRDGYCDKPCNNSQCQWDGGDCTADNPMLPFHGLGLQQEGVATSFFSTKLNKNYCNEDCANTWIADRYCDRTCNVRECGFDAGDCGLENFDKIPNLTLSANRTFYSLPEGECVGYFNLSDFLKSNYSITEGYYEESSVIRTIAISLKYSVIGIVLYPNQNRTNLTLTLKGKYHDEPFEKTIALCVSTKPRLSPVEVEETKKSLEIQTEENFTFESFPDSIKFPKVYSSIRNHSFSHYGRVNVSAMNFPSDIIKQIELLKDQLDSGILTVQGFLEKKGSVVDLYFKTLTNSVQSSLVYEENTELTTVRGDVAKPNESSQIPSSSLLNVETLSSSMPPHLSQGISIFQKGSNNNQDKNTLLRNGAFAKFAKSAKATSLKKYFSNLASQSTEKLKLVNTSVAASSATQRRLLDTFGDSLRHVNKLYNEAFGYEARKVPSHIAHFVDKSVMSRLTERFHPAFDATSSHKIRSSDDMQFAFSYYYYLMSEMESIEAEEIFDMFDTDNTGTWSDREIRTVLTRLHDLPLDFSTVTEFEQIINNCSFASPTSMITPLVPHYERYYDSKLPLVTKELILSCPPVKDLIIQHFGNRKRNNFEVVGEDEVAFKMIHNNLSQVLGQIDDLRKHPKKFVCLNDNMNHGTQEAEVIRAVIHDFYESMFPTRSQFELPPEYRNRFLYISELKEWRRIRDVIRFVTYSVLFILIFFSIISFWKTEMRQPERHGRLRHLQNRNRNPYNV